MRAVKQVLGGVCIATMLSAPVLAEDGVDPLEGWNRTVFSFNETLDRYLLKPVAKGYDFVTPQFVDNGISNIFSNLGEVRNLVNNLLQLKGGEAVDDLGRFAINSTVGLVGFFDVASKWGLEKNQEDFGQTLATWGVNDGPYLMLPLLGPATVRDGVGRISDSFLLPQTYIEDNKVRLAVRGTNVVDARSDLLATEELIEGDKYSFIRDIYLQRRDYLINDGEVEDDFTSDDLPEDE